MPSDIGCNSTTEGGILRLTTKISHLHQLQKVDGIELESMA